MTDRGKDKYGRWGGEEPAKYRFVFDLDPPLQAHQKGADGDNQVSHVEFFGNDVRTFYFLYAGLSRMATMARAQAIVLADGSVVQWRDKNRDEEAEWAHLYQDTTD